MIVDPFGDILAECHSFDDSFVTATTTAEKLANAGGNLYKKGQTTRSVSGYYRARSFGTESCVVESRRKE